MEAKDVKIIPECLVLHDDTCGFYIEKYEIPAELLNDLKSGDTVLVVDRMIPAFFKISEITNEDIFIKYLFRVLGLPEENKHARFEFYDVPE